MIIEKREFNKLKQLDRIEFRQKFEFIEINCNIFKEVTLAFLMFFAGYFINFFFSLIGWMFIFIAIGDLFIRSKKIKKLEKEYFEVKIK